MTGGRSSPVVRDSGDRWADLARLQAEWRAVGQVRQGPRSHDPRRAFEEVLAHHGSLVEAGRWVSGPHELMTVLGRADDELAHSRVVAWLLTPTGRHGLGSSLLRSILDAGWPDLETPSLALTVVSREVTKEDALGTSRADVVVRAGGMVLVIENKVWSPEGSGQCETLHRHWRDETSDVRFLLLSREGRLPISVSSEDARRNWRSVSYAQLATAIDDALPPAEIRAGGGGAVSQYLLALGPLVGPPVPFAITRWERR